MKRRMTAADARIRQLEIEAAELRGRIAAKDEQIAKLTAECEALRAKAGSSEMYELAEAMRRLIPAQPLAPKPAVPFVPTVEPFYDKRYVITCDSGGYCGDVP